MIDKGVSVRVNVMYYAKVTIYQRHADLIFQLCICICTCNGGMCANQYEIIVRNMKNQFEIISQELNN